MAARVAAGADVAVAGVGGACLRPGGGAEAVVEASAAEPRWRLTCGDVLLVGEALARVGEAGMEAPGWLLMAW